MEHKQADVEQFLNSEALPAHGSLFALVEGCSSLLENELTDYRPAASNGSCGGLLTFSDGLPLVVVPDLHARAEFLLKILHFTLPAGFLGGNQTVFDALEHGAARIVCVGDILHTEKFTKGRWLAAYEEFLHGVYTGPELSAEMTEGLALLCAVMKLKELFPAHFHVLKGNHENVMNVTGGGDFSFRKYADEGRMVKAFLQEYYGDDILYLISCFEKALPLVAATKNCVISHAEPRSAYTKGQLVNGLSDGSLIAGLTWTDNGQAQDGSALGMLRELCGEAGAESGVYLGGHRPVTAGAFALRQGGVFVQIHNPAQTNIALVTDGKKFNPETDIVGV